MTNKNNPGKYFYPIIIILFFVTLESSASSIKGKLIADSTWNQVVYLSLIPGFDQLYAMSNQMIIDHAEIDNNGHFSFETSYFPTKHRLYRLHISKKGDPPASLIIGGKDENHMYLIANKQSNISIINSDSGTIFGNAQIQNSPQTKLLNEVNQMVFYLDTANFNGSPLKRELMETALDEKLRQFADTCSYPLVALYAIYKSNFETHFTTNPEFYIRFLKKWEKEESTYFEEFRKKIPVEADRNFAFIYGIIGLLLGIALMYILGKRQNMRSPNPIHMLTVQERNIFTLLQKGKTNKEISDELNISLSTVKSHVNSIFSKLKVKSRKEILNL
ncbi:helix-turn-helix transcriptional regulator [uncultured Draconibacterium sp.]|uniref:helix-turn-helix domain-containing protein n=1 Tax=uncultured Draconibacterium sp. TaxID=1573823 RepID=UPI0029C876CD|nr:helix-turn-helix transcriptional regulator [uncultured Draconibacterium sp.]